MKITHINIDNTLGLSFARIAINKPVAFFGGGNGAGKTSLIESIRMAFTGAGQRGITTKNKFDALVRDGQKKGAVSVETDAGSCVLELPKGKHATFDVIESPFLPYLLDSTKFAGADDKKRRSDLMKLCRVELKGKDIAERMRKRGVSERLIDEVAVLISGGFPVAHDAATTKVSEQRGAWQAITGETWGQNKAADWQAPVPPASDAAVKASAAQQLADARQELAAASGKLVELRNQQRDSVQLERRRADLQALHDQMERRQTHHHANTADLDSVKRQLDDAKALAGDASATRYDCPCCNEQLMLVGGALVKGGAFNADAAARLPELERALKTTIAATENSARALADAQHASAELAKLPAAAGAGLEQDIAAVESQINVIQQDIEILQETMAGIARDEQANEQAAELTARANAAHQLLLEWQTAAVALAPDGIPADLTREAITPMNTLLGQLAAMAGWPAVQLSDSLQVVRGDRPYSLLSESEKWRADTMLTLAVANLSGLRFALIDRFDCLEPSARGEALDMFADAADAGLFDTVLVAGTLKTPLAEEELINSFWIAKNEVQAVAQAEVKQAA